MRRRGFDLGQFATSLTHFLDDLLGGLVPDKGLGVVVPVLGPRLDRFGELRHGVEHATTVPTFGELFEPPLDEVAPRRRRRGEVQMPAGTLRIGEPVGDWWGLVGREAVEHDVELKVFWHVEVDELEEPQHVGGLVTLLAVAEDLAGADVHGREQIGRPVALLVVGHGAGPSSLERQARLGPVERLDLGLLVEAEDDGPLGRAHVEPDDVDEPLLGPEIRAQYVARVSRISSALLCLSLIHI